MKKLILSLLILIIFVPVEYYFASQAYYTDGWGGEAVYLLASICFSSLSILFLFLDSRKMSLSILLTGFLTVVPINMYYANLWHDLKSESEEIVHWAYQVRLKTGAFPEKLKRKHSPRITYNKESGDAFSVLFYVANKNTGHFYTSKGGWGYMDD
ncbi:MAG: hypothetical protein ACO1N0_01075 [Fluviicola sp.]